MRAGRDKAMHKIGQGPYSAGQERSQILLQLQPYMLRLSKPSYVYLSRRNAEALSCARRSGQTAGQRC